MTQKCLILETLGNPWTKLLGGKDRGLLSISK